MSKPAAIAAQLVDVRNIAAHKCVRLEIHVPAEQANLVLDAFGWPTMVAPVEVAIARLNPSKVTRPIALPTSEDKERRSFSSLPLPQQIGMRCTDPEFMQFCKSRNDFEPGLAGDPVAFYVRTRCGVMSRADIQHGTEAAKLWKQLDDEFWFWRRGDVA